MISNDGAYNVKPAQNVVKRLATFPKPAYSISEIILNLKRLFDLSVIC